jgi:hypothetical protein
MPFPTPHSTFEIRISLTQASPPYNEKNNRTKSVCDHLTASIGPKDCFADLFDDMGAVRSFITRDGLNHE